MNSHSTVPSPNRLLIVDDEDGPRESLNLIFESDYEVEAVATGREAIALSNREPFATAIVDIRMEDKSGIEVLQELKGIYPFTEVIMLTAYETLETARQAISLGASDYLSKPFDVDHIQKVVRRCQERFAFMTRQDLILRDNVEKVKSEFLGILSHELNTPMNGVLGFLELLSDTKLEADQKRLLKEVKKCSLNLFDIIKDLLNYAQLVAREESVSNQEFDPADMLIGLYLKHNERNTKTVLNLRLSPHLPPKVRGPEFEIQTVLLKLLDNALKFTPFGEIGLALETSARDCGQLSLNYTIRDTGIGIPSSLLDSGRIFDPFHQGDNSLTRPYGGLGLGLSLCQKLCQRIKADLKIESTPGKGSCIQFNVPVNTAPGF